MADFVSSIIRPHHSYVNDTLPLPDAETWIAEMGGLYLTFTIIACVCTVIVVVMSVLQLRSVLIYVTNDRIKTDLYYLVFMYPVTTLCGSLGMFIPKAAPFLYSVALVYYMLCLFVIVSLLFNIFGSRREMSEYLKSKGMMIKFQVPPVCCLHFLPKLEPTERNLRRCEWMVFQTPLLRCVLEVANQVVYLELGHRRHTWFMFSNLAGLISMCVAFYGCYVLVPLGTKRLHNYRFGHIFRIVDVAQCLYTIQKFCFDLAANLDIIAPDKLLTSSAKAQFWTSFMLTWEMMLLSVLTSYLLRPQKTCLFDKHPHHNNRQTIGGSTDTVVENVDSHSTGDVQSSVAEQGIPIENRSLSGDFVKDFDAIA